MDNKLVLIALNQISGIGPKTIGRLLMYWPYLPDLIYQWRKKELTVTLPAPIHQALASINWKNAQQDLNWATQKNCFIISILDDEYPKLLKQLDDPPPILYLQGSLSILQNPASLAMVGSRNPSDYGKQNALKWSKDLSLSGMVLISGMAIGIDTLVHTACVANDKPTVAVLGSGLECIYPKKNTYLSHQIREKGTLLSEFSLKTPPHTRHFPRRNRIISGLALGTLIVESTEKSGTMITAMHALEQNREVFVLPGPVGIPNFLGNHRLIQQGARLVTSYQDILQEYENRIH